MSLEKPVPSDVDAEEAVLGSILIDPENALPAVSVIVQPSDFYREKNGWILEACLNVRGAGAAVNVVTLAHELQRVGRLEAVGSTVYLGQLLAFCPTSVHAEDYAELVRRTAFCRRLISTAGQIAALGYEEGGDPAELIGQAQEKLLALQGMASGRGLRSMREIAAAHLADVQAWMDDPSRARGEPTGLNDLDAALDGFEPGRFYVVGARASMGKSQMAGTMAANVAARGKTVAIFTLEMSELSVLFRMVLSKARINRYAVRLGTAPDGWQQDFWAAYGVVESLPIYVDDTASILTSTARSRAALLKAKHPNLGLVIYDYAELAGDEDTQSEERRVSQITRRLQAMARALEVPVLGIYQLSRQVEYRKDKMPQLADLRYSGMIEQSADVVMLLYRPSYYLERERKPVPPDVENLLWVNIAKQRDGPTGMVKLFFDRRTGYIGNWREEEWQG